MDKWAQSDSVNMGLATRKLKPKTTKAWRSGPPGVSREPAFSRNDVVVFAVVGRRAYRVGALQFRNSGSAWCRWSRVVSWLGWLGSYVPLCCRCADLTAYGCTGRGLPWPRHIGFLFPT